MNDISKLTKDKMLNTVYKHMSKFKADIPSWTNEDLDKFLLKLGITSRNTVMKYVSLIRRIYKFACKENGKLALDLQPSFHFSDYIDLIKFRRKTILYKEEFFGIRNLLGFVQGDLEANFRDKAIYDLAWLGLTAKQIQYLKKDDVREIRDENENLVELEIDVVDEYTIDNEKHTKPRTILVQDKDIVKDIYRAKYEDCYYKTRELRGRERIEVVEYAWSEYLIRGIKIGTVKVGEPIDNPNKALSQQLKKHASNSMIIDLNSLSIEDIRRSKIINYILEYEHMISPAMIVNLMGRSVESDVAWLIPIAKKLTEVKIKTTA